MAATAWLRSRLACANTQSAAEIASTAAQPRSAACNASSRNRRLLFANASESARAGSRAASVSIAADICFSRGGEFGCPDNFFHWLSHSAANDTIPGVDTALRAQSAGAGASLRQLVSAEFLETEIRPPKKASALAPAAVMNSVLEDQRKEAEQRMGLG